MFTPVATTKFRVPPRRPDLVERERLLDSLNLIPDRQCAVVSAPAGFGKTTLVGRWVSTCALPVAWLSLDREDAEWVRFLSCLVASIRTAVLRSLQATPSPPAESVCAVLLNEIADLEDDLVLILDDYHLIESHDADRILAFLLEHLPSQLHLVIVTRSDPNLALARLRAQNRIVEIRSEDLRFHHAEAVDFYRRYSGLDLTPEQISMLEERTEGWVSGLQLAALSLQGQSDVAGFIDSFSGSHRFIREYLMEEVLNRQSEPLQRFLLQTSVLEKFCGSLCDAVLRDPSLPGEDTLDSLQHANLFLVSLDTEGYWYRYHHLFGAFLQQHLRKTPDIIPAVLHVRAALWFEGQGMDLEAFQHAVAAGEIDLAMRVMEGKGMPLLFRGAVPAVLNWLESLPAHEKDRRPALWVSYGSALVFAGRLPEVEPVLQRAEVLLNDVLPDDSLRDLRGHISTLRATLALTRHDADGILTHSRSALELLSPDNLPIRSAARWICGYAHQLNGERDAAGRAYDEALPVARSIGHGVVITGCLNGLAVLHEADNRLRTAAGFYHEALDQAGKPLMPSACELYLGLARIHYQWNDLNAAESFARTARDLAARIDTTDRSVACDLFLADLYVTRKDPQNAAILVRQAEQAVKDNRFDVRLPDTAVVKSRLYLMEGDTRAAMDVVEQFDLPLGKAGVLLASGRPESALRLLDEYLRLIETRKWKDQWLRAGTLKAATLWALNRQARALEMLDSMLDMAEPGGFVRLFLDMGTTMKHMLRKVRGGNHAGYVNQLLAACAADREVTVPGTPDTPSLSPPVDSLTTREREVLRLIAEGLSNRQICRRLSLALDTVKGHNRRIFEKLQVQRRTEAVARATRYGIL